MDRHAPIDMSGVYDLISRMHEQRAQLYRFDNISATSNRSVPGTMRTPQPAAQPSHCRNRNPLQVTMIADEAVDLINEQACLLSEQEDLNKAQRERIEQLERENGDLRRRLESIVPGEDEHMSGQGSRKKESTFEETADWVRDRVMFFLYEMRDGYGRRGDRRMERAVIRVAGEVVRLGIEGG